MVTGLNLTYTTGACFFEEVSEGAPDFILFLANFPSSSLEIVSFLIDLSSSFSVLAVGLGTGFSSAFSST